MVQLTDEDRETARKINDALALICADIRVAYPDGILKSHISAWAGSFMQTFLLLATESLREDIWQTVQTGIRRRFEDGKL